MFVQKNSNRLYRRLMNLKSANHDRERFGRAGFMGLFGQRVNLLDHYEKKLEDMEENVRAEQSSSLAKVSSGFTYSDCVCMLFTLQNLYLDMANAHFYSTYFLPTWTSLHYLMCI